MNGKHLAVDLGSSNGKMILAEIGQDERLTIEEVGRFPTPRVWLNGHICIDTYRILAEIVTVLSRLGQDGIALGSMGVDSWSSDYGVVTSFGDQIGLPVFYRDRRNNAMTEEVHRIISYEKLYAMTTQRRIRESTLCQLLALRKENPSLLQNGNKILFLGDLLMSHFSGKICSEVTLASYSQMFSMKKMAWEDDVFELFDLPTSLQPEIVHPCDCLGRISQNAAAWYGINQFEIVAPAAHDTSSAVAAVPVEPGKRWAFISTGSWFLVGMELDAPICLDQCYRYDFSNTALAFGKTMLKRNVMAMWLLQACKTTWAQMGISYSDAEIVSLAARAKPFYAILDTEDSSLFNPLDMPQAIMDCLATHGQPSVKKDDVGQIARLIYEGIAYKCAYAIDCLEKVTGQTLDIIQVVGGASCVDMLNQMIASATNKEVAAGPREAASIGNCLLQACGCGELSSREDIRQIVRNTYVLKHYYPENVSAWACRRDAYDQVCGLEL
ncbi:MAG: FGGY family carbohydrate kinase [Clostridia bacterium]